MNQRLLFKLPLLLILIAGLSACAPSANPPEVPPPESPSPSPTPS